MAGTPNRNTRRPQSGGTRRPAQGARRPQSGGTRRPTQGTRRPSGGARTSGRRRPVRRRSQPLFLRPGFWLFICIVIIIAILFFRSCGKKDTENTENSVYTTLESVSEGPVIIGNTSASTVEKETEPDSEPTSDAESSSLPDEEEPSESIPDQSTETPTEENTEPDEEQNVDDSEHDTFRIEPGIYLIGSDVFAGTVQIEAMSGTGALYTTDGALNIPNFGNEEGYTSVIDTAELERGAYLTVSGNLNLKVSYSVKYEKAVTAQLVATDTTYPLSDLGGGTSYAVMEEGGGIKPGIYFLQATAGNGFVYVPGRGGVGQVDFMIGVDGGYIDSVNYVVLTEGDAVVIEGCTVEFIEMKEG